MDLTLVILAGGSGTRLWPISRSLHPKQFLQLTSKKTMIQETVDRLEQKRLKKIIVVCNEEHRFLVAQQLSEIEIPTQIICEPVARNTAPAISLAAFIADESDKLLVVSSDHYIADSSAFNSSVNQGINLLQKGHLTIFGITPVNANINYGYIKKGKNIDANGFIVEKFVEKPSEEVAKEYINSNDYLWNSGIFLFSAKNFLNELKIYNPNIYNNCSNAILNAKTSEDFIRPSKTHFSKCDNISVDYAVMEHTKKAAMIPLNAGWSDLGSWNSMWDHGPHDKNNNVIKGEVISHNVHNSYIESEDRLVTVLGLDNIFVINTKDAIFVSDKENIGGIKKIIDKLKQRNLPQIDLHRKVTRPWGTYDSLDVSPVHQVKRITVFPGQKLSVQKHFRRSEHWVIVSGVAEVTKDKETISLKANESIYLPRECIHALRNPADEILELIEVQTGDYFGEDDIVRFDDIYGRE